MLNNISKPIRNQFLIRKYLCTRSIKFACDANPAPGSPFHLALPVHDMKLARDVSIQLGNEIIITNIAI